MWAVLSACAYDNPYYITIRNDRSNPVEILQCDDEACRSGAFHRRELLEPDETYRATVSTRGVPNPWLVRDQDGQALGCLPLVMPKPTEGLIADVSDAVPCRERHDESQFWPPLSSRQEALGG